MKKLEIEITNLTYEYLKKELEEICNKRYKLNITVEELAAAIVTNEITDLHNKE